MLDIAEFLLENLLVLALNHRRARYEYAITAQAQKKHGVRAREKLIAGLVIDPAHDGVQDYRTRIYLQLDRARLLESIPRC